MEPASPFEIILTARLVGELNLIAQYIITIIIFVGLTSATVVFSLLPWAKEHHLRAWQDYRFHAVESTIDGRFQEGKTYWTAALGEAKALSDRDKIEECNKQIAAVDARIAQQSNECPLDTARFCHEQLEAGGPYDNAVWPSSLEYLRIVRRNRSVKVWEPTLKLIFRKERVAAKNNPQHLIELGDALMEMARFEPSKSLYLSAFQAAEQQKSLSQQLEALDRQARASYSRKEYGEANRVLKEAVKLSQTRGSRVVESGLLLHQAQVLCDWGESLDIAFQNCETVLQRAQGEKEPLFTWYANLLYREIECKNQVLEHRKHLKTEQQSMHSVPIDETIKQLNTVASFASKEFGENSVQLMRTLETLGAAYAIAGKNKEMRDTFTKFLAIKAKRTDDDPLCQRELGKEAKCFSQSECFEVAIPLWQWQFELKMKQKPPDTQHAILVLMYISEAYRTLGDMQLAIDFANRAEELRKQHNREA